MKPGARAFVLAVAAIGAAAGGLWLGLAIARVLHDGATLFDLAAYALCVGLLCAAGRQVLAVGGRPALLAYIAVAALWTLLVAAFGP